MAYLGALLVDVPSYGWVQATLDDEHGLAAGIGVNLSERMSLGYLMEKNITETQADLGWNHELSLAYKFKDQEMSGSIIAEQGKDQQIDRIVRNYEEQIALLKEEQKARPMESGGNAIMANDINDRAITAADMARQNRLILDELILRQDSIEAARTAAFEQRFETVVRLLRHDVKNTVAANANGTDQFERRDRTVANMQRNLQEAYQQERKQNHGPMPVKMLGDSDAIGVKAGITSLQMCIASRNT